MTEISKCTAKKIETIETADDYFKIIKEARNPPFTVIKASEIAVHDFETFLPKEVNIPKKLKINQANRIIYSPNGRVEMFENYCEGSVQYIM